MESSSRRNSSELVAVLGGSFDPIHLGHVQALEQVQAHYKPSNFLIVPTAQNPHKGKASAQASHRLAMVRLALEDKPFEVLDWEMKEAGPQYTLPTLEKVRSRYAANSELLLVLGDDSFADFASWKEPKSILQMANVAVIMRSPEVPGTLVEIVRQCGIRNLVVVKNRIMHSNNLKFVEPLEIDVLPFSSTLLRAQIAKCWKEKNMTRVPMGIDPKVWSYIKENQLYSVAD